MELRSHLSPSEMAGFRDLLGACNAAESIELPFFFPEDVSDPRHDEFLLALAGNQLVGFGHLPRGNEPEGCLMVHPDRRRLGIGTAILDAFRNELRQRGLDSGLLVADQASPSGRAFFAKHSVPYLSSEFRLEWRKSESSAPAVETRGLSMRQAVDADDELLAGLMRRSFDRELDEARDRIANGLRETKRHFYVASLDGSPVGMLRAGEVYGAGDITAFGVLPEHRRKGIGRWMLTEAVCRLARHGFDRVLIEVANDNANALGLYQSCGFQIVAEYGFYTLSASRDVGARG